MKHVLKTAMLTVLVLLFAASASATVVSTPDGAGEPDCLYVAGCPDAWPLEAYDPDAETYRGAAPAFLELVSERTGLKFAYIRAGEEDRRSALVQNRQVELFFASSEEAKLFDMAEESVRLFPIGKDGTVFYCVFTSVLSAGDRAAIRAVAEGLTRDEVARLLTADELPRRDDATVRLLSVGLVLAIGAVAALILRLRKGERQQPQDCAATPNTRLSFLSALQSAVSIPSRELCYVCVFAFNIGWVNQHYGNRKSDELLLFTAKTLSKRMKANEFCGRIGGGSFAAALCCSSPEQAEQRVKEIITTLNSTGLPDREAFFRAGVCASALDHKDAEKLLSDAEQAYHQAAEEQKDLLFASRDALKKEEIRSYIRNHAREALERKEFSPYVQFFVDAQQELLRGGELLSRWQNRSYGQLRPGVYIPVLEEIGLIGEHDCLMLEYACRLLQEWEEQGRALLLSCNLTRITISDEHLVEKVLALAEPYSFPRERLIIELTEDTLELDKNQAIQNIAGLKEAGFRVGLDNGGRSSLMNLYEYPIDLVKLNRQMIVAAEQKEQAAVLLKSMVALCHELGIQVLVHGVEKEELNRLALLSGCDYLQGFYYARPLPLRELNGFLQNYGLLC